jgi:acyl-CoA reductase-like NAD-dependent aldehyde dehydrogenase
MTVATPISTTTSRFLEGAPKELLIGGEWVPAKSGETLESINPSTGEVILSFAAGDAADIDAAVRAARAAFEDPAWSGMNPHARTRLLLRIADLIEEHAQELVELESIDNGMPLMIAQALTTSSAEVFRYYAGWPTKLYGDTNPSDPSVFSYTLREPIGVCGQIIPWNGPLGMAAWKLAPVLACGNTTILKPAEQTPLTALRLGELLIEAGVPDGVVNIVTGLGETAGAAIANHPGIDKVAFTGSTEVGRSILRASAGNLKRVTLELGGKSPNIIFADATIDAAVGASVGGFTLLSGQVCTAGTRIFVQEPVVDEFVEKLVGMAGGLKAGDPFDPESNIGPLISREQFARVSDYVTIGDEGGATRRIGGPQEGKGNFVTPTVFTGVDNDMRIAREEIFGPVAAIIPFKDENDAVLQGNDTVYGLAAALWTRDVSRAQRVSRALKAGSVWVNTYLETDPIAPFGGYKQSGIGRELGHHSLDAYTQPKTVYMRL